MRLWISDVSVTRYTLHWHSICTAPDIIAGRTAEITAAVLSCRWALSPNGVVVIVFSSLDASSITANAESRVIEGTAVTYGTTGTPGGEFAGRRMSFAPGAFGRSLRARADKVRLLVQHDHAHPIGKLVDWQDTGDGLFTSWKIASTTAGDQALVEASEGIRDGLSVGAEVITHKNVGNTIHVTEARLLEVSLVTVPAFDDARVTRVAASHHDGLDPRSLRLSLILKGI